MTPCPECGVLLKSPASMGGHYATHHRPSADDVTTDDCPRRGCGCDLCRAWSRNRARSLRRAVSPLPWRTLKPTPDWFDRAACKGKDPGMWHPDGLGHLTQASKAIAICRRCPVRIDCLEHALAEDEGIGIWGGLQPSERLRIAAYREQRRATL